MSTLTSILGRSLQLSVSASQDLKPLGYANHHMLDIVLSMARHVTRYGGRVNYGGDWREKGFTEYIAEEVKGRDRPSGPAPVRNYLSWSVIASMNSEELKRLTSLSNPYWRYIEIVLLQEDGNELEFDDIKFPISRPVSENRTASLTNMRKRIRNDSDAHFIIGGQQARRGRQLPGIVEEFLLAMDAGHPIYLSAAFGGAALTVARALNLEVGRLFEDIPQSDSLITRIRDEVGPERLSRPKEILRNGLTEGEATKLLTSHRVNDAVSLTLLGLSRVFAS